MLLPESWHIFRHLSRLCPRCGYSTLFLMLFIDFLAQKLGNRFVFQAVGLVSVSMLSSLDNDDNTLKNSEEVLFCASVALSWPSWGRYLGGCTMGQCLSSLCLAVGRPRPLRAPPPQSSPSGTCTSPASAWQVCVAVPPPGVIVLVRTKPVILTFRGGRNQVKILCYGKFFSKIFQNFLFWLPKFGLNVCFFCSLHWKKNQVTFV